MKGVANFLIVVCEDKWYEGFCLTISISGYK